MRATNTSDFNISLTNARSLLAKLASTAACLEELELNALLVTETFYTERRVIKNKIKKKPSKTNTRSRYSAKIEVEMSPEVVLQL